MFAFRISSDSSRSAWTMARELQGAGAPEAVLDAEVMIGVFTIEGLLMHPLGEEQERAICDTLAARWFSSPAQ